MRCCGNCYNGHFNLSERGEEMFCDDNPYCEQWVSFDDCCESHRYESGYEEEKNYILYDEKYFGPGFLIINKQCDEVVKYLKLYIMNNNGFPCYGLRAFCNNRNNPDDEYNKIDFSFRDIEDDENGLYPVFNKLCATLNNEHVESIDKFNQGRNYFSLKDNDKVVVLTVAKDVYGVKYATDFIDINIGDDLTCKHYDAISAFYNQLANLPLMRATEEEVSRLQLLK